MLGRCRGEAIRANDRERLVQGGLRVSGRGPCFKVGDGEATGGLRGTDGSRSEGLCAPVEGTVCAKARNGATGATMPGTGRRHQSEPGSWREMGWDQGVGQEVLGRVAPGEGPGKGESDGAALVLLRGDTQLNSFPANLSPPPALCQVPREPSVQARMEDPCSSKTHACLGASLRAGREPDLWRGQA